MTSNIAELDPYYHELYNLFNPPVNFEDLQDELDKYENNDNIWFETYITSNNPEYPNGLLYSRYMISVFSKYSKYYTVGKDYGIEQNANNEKINLIQIWRFIFIPEDHEQYHNEHQRSQERIPFIDLTGGLEAIWHHDIINARHLKNFVTNVQEKYNNSFTFEVRNIGNDYLIKLPDEDVLYMATFDHDDDFYNEVKKSLLLPLITVEFSVDDIETVFENWDPAKTHNMIKKTVYPITQNNYTREYDSYRKGIVANFGATRDYTCNEIHWMHDCEEDVCVLSRFDPSDIQIIKENNYDCDWPAKEVSFGYEVTDWNLKGLIAVFSNNPNNDAQNDLSAPYLNGLVMISGTWETDNSQEFQKSVFVPQSCVIDDDEDCQQKLSDIFKKHILGCENGGCWGGWK